MTPARLAFYSTVLVSCVGIGSLAFVFFLVQAVGPFSHSNATAAMVATVLLAFIAACFLLSWLLKSNAARYQIRLVNRDGKFKNFSSGILLGFMFGVIWRLMVIGVGTQAGAVLLKRAYGPEITDGAKTAIDLIALGVNWFLSFWWVYAAPFGNHRILFGTKNVTIEPPDSTMTVESSPYANLQESTSSLKEAIAGTLGVIAAVSYYGLGLLQLAAVVSFFNSVWGWWLIPSLLVASLIAYMPVVGAVAGIYAAVHAWGWSLYAAIALFCFPLLMWVAIMLIAGAATATQSLFGGKARKASA